MTHSPRSSSSEYADAKTVVYDSCSDRPSQSKSEVRLVECGCCCDQFPFENIVQCRRRHVICFGCVQRQVEEILYGNYEARGCLRCMNMDGCKKPIPFCEIRRAVPNDLIERYESRQAQNAIIRAKLENLVYCPFCGIPCEVDKCVQVMECPNPNCLKSSCIQCKEPSHLPLLCEENENISETAHRRKVEERMTKAIVRECKTCKAEMVKTGGCNSLKCARCRTLMCYLCRQTITSGYEHFCRHSAMQKPGKPCKICNITCTLLGDEIEDNVALVAKEEALKELGGKEPSLLEQNIGPTLVMQSTSESGRNTRRRR